MGYRYRGKAYIGKKTKYDADDAVSFTTPNGVPVHTLGSSNDSVQIALLGKR